MRAACSVVLALAGARTFAQDGIAASNGLRGPARSCEGEVIYSTLEWASYSDYDQANGNGWSGFGVFHAFADLQIADDFWTTEANVITCVTGAYLGFLGARPEKLQVDIWTHTGAGPGSLVASQTVPIHSFDTYDDGLFGLVGVYLTAALEIPLAPHTPYYIVIQPVDRTCGGDWYYMITNPDSRLGTTAYLRDGSRGELPGYGVSYWTSTEQHQNYGTRDYSMEVRAVPGPPPCRADCNGNGTLDTEDVLCFLDAWTQGCPHDGHVLHSTLDWVDSQSYDTANRNTWSGRALLNEIQDEQLTDDFTTTEANTLTRVTADFVTGFGGEPAHGLQVDVWTHTISGPGDLVSSVTAPLTGFDEWQDSVLDKVGVRLTADVHIPLAKDTPYYITIQPIDLSLDGDLYHQIRNTQSLVGGDAYGRDGGRCPGGYSRTWRSASDLGLGAGDTAMEILALPDEPVCAADCDGDGLVDVRDLVCFLNHWAAGCAG